MIKRALFIIAVAVFNPVLSSSLPSAPPPLELESKIALGHVTGRIDHLAVDLAHHRLFVAELGNGSVSVIDLATAKVIERLSHFKEPQGLAYVPRFGTLYVASGGDGSVRLINGGDLKEVDRITVGEDADNVRLDAQERLVVVGYGQGGLAMIEPETRRQIADVALGGHPEGFQLEANGNRVFVNLPDRGSIAVVDQALGKVLTTWPTGRLHDNFPMALDAERKQVLVVFRSPPQLVAYAMADGAVIAKAAACGDSDDVFVDAKRQRIYISCGEGFVDVFAQDGGLHRIGHLPTVSGARTALFVPKLDRLFVAIRARPNQPAAIWIYRPAP